ncbi:IclR-like transcriptional regulator [Candidatus Halobonum tyrrellensis G22]|uniref:IclR-like transcriptional regulator n=1 Tax=Candidatus Halobonum tyrrellensis G22 TaxID=1324957 RepID=V4GSM6_9EURY|nr:IclR-like transcriptional regulator [Candidatus Halobonum tyrrellensis G22]
MRGRAFAVVVVCLLLVSSGSAVAAPSLEMTVDDDGVVVTADNVAYLAAWQPQSVSVSVNGTGVGTVCLGTSGGGSDRTLACRPLTGNATQTTVQFAFDGWPNNDTGERTLVATARSNGTVLASTEQSIHIVAADGDVDQDGLGNRAEINGSTGFLDPDSDDDGLDDGAEVRTYETDPTVADTDDDNLSDGAEVNEYETNPLEPDTDNDNLSDGAEVLSHGTDPATADTDGDGLDDGAEIHEYNTSPTKADTDGDGLNDGAEVNVHDTDPTTADTDGDGLDDGAEVNEYGTNPNEPDTDGDGLADGPEVNEYGTDPTEPDTDGDGRPDGAEVQSGTNPTDGLDETTLLGVGLVAGACLAAGAVAVLVRRRGGSLPFVGSGDDSDPDDAGAAATTETADESDPAADPVGGEGDDAAGADEPMPTALSNERQVLKLLDEHGGRMPQGAIVNATGWSKSKVSRVLSGMEEDDEIRKISIGRENIVVRHGEEPDWARSPLEESS